MRDALSFISESLLVVVMLALIASSFALVISDGLDQSAMDACVKKHSYAVCQHEILGGN